MPAKQKSDKAIRLAVQAMRAERQRLAFDANLYDLGIADYPPAKKASERRKEINAAIAELTGQPEPVSRIVAEKNGPFNAQPAPNPEQMEMFS
jgi:hypothetical protein